jgi:hypothetical protein
MCLKKVDGAVKMPNAHTDTYVYSERAGKHFIFLSFDGHINAVTFKASTSVARALSFSLSLSLRLPQPSTLSKLP